MPYKPDRYDPYAGSKRPVNNRSVNNQPSGRPSRNAQSNRARMNRIAAERRRRARRRQTARRLLAFAVMVVVFVTLSLFLWSRRDDIGSSLAAVTGLFSGEKENKPTDKKPTEEAPAETSDSEDPVETTASHFGQNGHDFILQSDIPLFMDQERAIVLIDAGHGGIDGGAPGYLGDGTQVKEANIVLDIAFKLKAELEARDIETYMIREDDTFFSLYARVARASLLSLDYMSALQPELVNDRDYVSQMTEKLMIPININSDDRSTGAFGFMKGYGMSKEQMELIDLQQNCSNVIFVSLHCNAHDYDTTLHGLQAYYCHDDVVEIDEADGLAAQTDPVGNAVYHGRDNERNQLLAQYVYDGTVGKAPFLSGTNAGKPVLAGNYAVLREHGLAGTLLELGYMSNSSDLQQLRDPDTQQKIAAGIGLGIEKYFLKLFNP
ncbi:MAG: N-acetylmuramoyl-L-alanine amidase [Clostridiaceae bacterium]|nr:N-acetylmuramoyl-L-alanine amidase [Clostridiaceae bacterium]